MQICKICHKTRILNDVGQCHECEQTELESPTCAECGREQDACQCEGGPYIPRWIPVKKGWVKTMPVPSIENLKRIIHSSPESAEMKAVLINSIESVVKCAYLSGKYDALEAWETALEAARHCGGKVVVDNE